MDAFYEQLLANVPDYREFLTAAEMEGAGE